VGIFSCYDVKKKNPGAKSGLFKVAIDSESTNMNKQNVIGQAEVLCNFDIDDGAWTLYESICSSIDYNGNSPYARKNKDTRHPQKDSNIGQMYKQNANQCTRLERVFIDSLFKHSEGKVRTYWANNKPGGNEYITDVFGTPESGKHILADEHKCSDKEKFSIAKAFRQGTNGANNGYCFKDGQNNQNSNCICGDRHDTTLSFGKCSGGHGNWRRYNSRKNRNARCSGQHTKCRAGIPYGPLGDTYGCDVGGQRTIRGHFWATHPGYSGLPCNRGYGSYGCYGSRWIA
jgi:hypothetical protein